MIADDRRQPEVMADLNGTGQLALPVRVVLPLVALGAGVAERYTQFLCKVLGRKARAGSNPVPGTPSPVLSRGSE